MVTFLFSFSVVEQGLGEFDLQQEVGDDLHSHAEEEVEGVGCAGVGWGGVGTEQMGCDELDSIVSEGPVDCSGKVIKSVAGFVKPTSLDSLLSERFIEVSAKLDCEDDFKGVGREEINCKELS